MDGFESVSEAAFDALIEGAATTGLFRSRYAQFSPTVADDFRVHRGDLDVDGDFTAPGYCTLILGDLTVSGYVDLRNPYEAGFDEGGLFVVLGDVRCRVFAGEGGKCAFVDGDLTARDLLLNAYVDSSLVVTGALRTRFFLGIDIWAEVGAGAEMEYGLGYAVPIDRKRGAPSIEPRHGEDASLALLAEDVDLDDLSADALMDLVRAGEPVFR